MHRGLSSALWQPRASRATLVGDQKARTAAGRRGLDLLAPRVTAGRPPVAWALALLFLFKGLVCLATVAFPLSASEPTKLVAGAGATGIVAACGVWLLAERIPLIGFELLAAIGVLVTSALVAQARSHGGMMITAFAYPWTAIYAAHFFPRRTVNALGLLISLCFGAGLLASDLSHVAIYWVIVTSTLWSICIVLGNLSDRLRRELNTDHLTGLLNRSGFIAAALRERALADRIAAPLSIAVIDLDDFKQTNDHAGHAAGDTLLARVAGSWRERMRPSDILARHGGDEFVLALPRTSEVEAALAVARLCDREDPVRWSVGISEWLPGEELEEVLARADDRLYEAKLCKQPIAADYEYA